MIHRFKEHYMWQDSNNDQTIQDIRDHDYINRAFLAAYSAQTGAPAVVIYNRNEKLEEAVKRLNSIF